MASNEIGMRSGWNRLLNQLKVQKNLTSDASLAKLLGVSRSFISAVRNKRKNIPAELGERIFSMLGISIREENLELFKPLRVQLDKERRPDSRIKTAVLKRANARCELCGCPAPFMTPQGVPYLEFHHICPVQLGGRSSTTNLVALCPNCNRKVGICPTLDELKLLAKRSGKKINKELLEVLEHLIASRISDSARE